MKDDNVDDDDKDENDNGIIGASAAAAAPATATTTHNFPFVWHVKMCGVSVKLHFKKERKKNAINSHIISIRRHANRTWV